MSLKLRIVLFFLAASTLLFCRLGGAPLFAPDEGRYSNIAHTMLTTGDWLTPRMDGISHYHKPPLSNWLVAASFKIFGANEFAARLPSVLLSLALMVILMSLGTFLFGFQTGYFSAWTLLTSALYAAVSRLVTTDMLLVFLTFLAMNCIARLLLGTTRKVFWFYAAIVSLALGMLTKGPVAWVITLLPAIIFAVWKRKNPRIAWYHWILGFILFWGLSLSWYLAVILTNKGAFDYFIHYQLAGRILSGHSGRRQGLWYFFVVLPLGFIPWSVFAPSAARWIWKQAWDTQTKERLLFIFLWFLIPFICFTIFKTKLATYIVPVFPPMALLSGFFWAQWQAGKVPPSPAMIRSAYGIGIVFILLSAGGLVFVSILPEFVQGISFFKIGAAAVFLLTTGLFSLFILKKQKWSWLFPAQVTTLCLLALLVFSILPSIEYKNSKVFAEKIMEIRKPGEKVILWKNYYASMPFYLKERVITVAVNMETTFEPEENVRGYIYEHAGDITELLKTQDRVFIMTGKKLYGELVPFAQVPLYTLLETRKTVLVSNKPS